MEQYIMDTAPNISIHVNDPEAAKQLTERPLKIEYRYAPARKVLDEVVPVKTQIRGTISSVTRFLDKRIHLIDVNNAVILVDRAHVKIKLIINMDDPYREGFVEGVLELDPRFTAFGINEPAQAWQPVPLAMFMKMNRSFFTSKEENMQYVSTLMNYKATIEQKVERNRNEKGDITDNFQQVVNSNLPQVFHLSIPIFKGYPKESIEVETFANVDGRDVRFALLSPGANDTLEDLRDKAIDEELEEIKLIFEREEVFTIPVIEV